MPYNDKVFLDFPDETTTEKPAATGEIREFIHPTYGKQLYRLVRNTSGGAIVAGRAVAYASGSSLNVAYTTANQPAVTVAGIAVVDIPDQSYGWVVCSGDVAAASNAAVVINTPVITAGAAGQVNDTAVSTVEHCVIGVFLAAVGSALAVNIRVQGIM